MIETVTVLCVLSFSLSIDYSLALISIHAYWISLGGKHNLSGLIFGLYDAPTIVFTPIFAWMLDKKIITYKKMFFGCVIANIIGNILYAMAYTAKSWELILTGRLIAGIGSSCLPLLMSYIADRLNKNKQQTTIGYVKYISVLSRTIGPILSSIFSSFVHSSSVVNVYTLVGWVPIIFGIITLIMIFDWKEDMSEQIIEQQNESTINACNIFIEFYPIWIIGALLTFIYWFYVGSSFVLATHFYHIVHSEKQLGMLYYSGLIGYILSFCTFFFYKEKISSTGGLIVSVCLMSTIFLFLIKENIMYHLIIGTITYIYGLTIPSVNGINNNIAKKLKPSVGHYFNLIVISLTMIQATMRFIAPTLFTLSVHQHNEKDCNFDDTHYETRGCSLTNYNTIVITYNTLSMVIMLFACVILWFRHKQQQTNTNTNTIITQTYTPPMTVLQCQQPNANNNIV